MANTLVNSIVFSSICIVCFMFSQSTSVVDSLTIRLPQCHQIAFDNCLKENFFSFGRKQNVSLFVTSVEGFGQICRSFNASLDCIRNHLSRCGSPLHRDLFDLATGEMQYRFYQFMCRDNPERQAFFTHASCIREHVFAVDQAIPCLNNYLLAFENVQEVNAVQPNYGYALTDWIRTICCAHQAKRDCTNRLAEEHCGNQAAQAFDIFFEQIHFGFFSMICRSALSELDPNSEVCQRALPNRGKPPKGLRSDSAVSKLLVSYFPFNYVTQAQRKEIYRVYRKRLMEKGKNFN